MRGRLLISLPLSAPNMPKQPVEIPISPSCLTGCFFLLLGSIEKSRFDGVGDGVLFVCLWVRVLMWGRVCLLMWGRVSMLLWPGAVCQATHHMVASFIMQLVIDWVVHIIEVRAQEQFALLFFSIEVKT